MSDFPKMMYRDHPDYVIAHTQEQANEFKAIGYRFEAWGANAQEQIKAKKDNCKVCGRNLKKFSHLRCKDEEPADVVGEREEEA